MKQNRQNTKATTIIDKVAHDAKRTREECRSRLDALQAHLTEGAAQAERGEYVAHSLDDTLKEFKTARKRGPI